MNLAQDSEVIEALAPDRSDQPLDIAILPRCSRRYRHALGTNAAQGDVAVDSVVVIEVREAAPAAHLTPYTTT